jgi:hypothetical protein
MPASNDYHAGYQDGWEEGTACGYETGREDGYNLAMRLVAKDFFTATDPLPEGQEDKAAPSSQE